MLTERQAIEAMFTQIQEELKQLKEEYRQDVAELEKRQFNLLDRLQRIDDQEREKLPKTMIKTIEKEILKQEAAAAIEKAEAIKTLDAQQQETAAAAPEKHKRRVGRPKKTKLQEPPKEIQIRKPAGPTARGPELIAAIESILEENGPLTAGKLEKILYHKHGWQWANIYNALNNVLENYPNNIFKDKKKFYFQPIKTSEANESGQNDIQQEAAPV